MVVCGGDFEEEAAVADVGAVNAVDVDEIFTYHRADFDVADWVEVGEDLIFLSRGGRHGVSLG